MVLESNETDDTETMAFWVHNAPCSETMAFWAECPLFGNNGILGRMPPVWKPWHSGHYYTVQQILLLVGVKHFFQNIHAICGIMRELNFIMPPKYITNCGILDFSTVKMPTVKMPTVKMPTVKMPRFANRGIMDFSTV